MLVLGAVVNEQEQAGGRQALDQAVEDRLGPGVDPVQVLDDQEQRLRTWLSRRSRPLMASRYAGGVARDRGPASAGLRPGRPGASGRPAGSARVVSSVRSFR